MRFRGKSIRRKIVALLLVPLLSLTAIWGFATVVTGRDVAQLFRVSDVMQNIGYPTEDTVRVLEQERRQTLVYLADPRASDSLPALQRTRTASDRAIAKVRENAQKRHLRHGLGTQGSEHLTAVLDAFSGLDSLRHSVESGTISRAQALDLYNRLIDPCYSLLAGLDGIDDVEMDKQSHALVNLTRARELLSREDALLGSSLVAGRLTREEIREISDLVAQRTLLYDISLPLLPASERERYERFWDNAGTAPLRSAEQSVIEHGSGPPDGVTAKSWDSAAGSALADLGTLDDQASDRFQDRMHPVAMRVIAQGAVAGLLGLLALLFSLVLSVRIGRGLIRDLRRLRLEAHEASGVRLPGLMRRLSAGEQVDVETEVPRLEYDQNEIGEVGQALNTLQRAAVEAAVKQSELRAGVSEVFVNLARRSQVLLHKQLTLLDTMERRTEDTDELADLFRLDHLTTRMRRHAEGLVILSGAAPSRQWRRPVQLMDVVRAAVAEVEDYERVEVRRLPRVAVTGPAVADLTHLVAELLENATVFSPPHTAVQVIGERVANGFTLEIHDRGLGMTPEALLDNNLRLAETPEFELSDTDRLGLFVVSRLAQRQNVRVSLQPSPYGGTTAIVFIPDALLSDEVPDTNGIGFRLDRERTAKNSGRAAGGSRAPLPLSGLPTTVLDGPVELEAPVGLDALDDFPGALPDEDSERGGLFRHRRALPRGGDDGPGQDPGDDRAVERPADRPVGEETGEHGLVPLPRRQPPKLVSSHGRPVTDQRAHRPDPARRDPAAPDDRATGEAYGPDAGAYGGDRNPYDVYDPYGGDREPQRADREPHRAGPVPLPRRAAPALRPAEPADRVGEDGTAAADGLAPTTGPGETARPGIPALPRRTRPAANAPGGPGNPGGPTRAPRDGDGPAAPGDSALPRRVRQASLAPQLRQDPERRPGRTDAPDDRDADEVRSRMASLQRGWQRGREENATGETARTGTAQGTTKGDGR
ncbi:nitrate- and nitrite sensing domain-containing protein [Streptomyces sp. WP-1]|uniref:sensor histidine kinase n=1 Tax=Streptomyces sp. WP-1 TaxID=3041497 RepID=UPI0026487D77|nr:nitrate- and nitrite sensing domain-containing protein [Streptomyces sp. WP-1]WKE72805.1 nitrate- and nitrite sensing domain-containing protein [Streptomyces sp. WP-1]